MAEVAQLITAVGLLITALVGVATFLTVKTVHKATNSMKDELVEAVRKAARAEGVQEERDRNKRNELS